MANMHLVTGHAGESHITPNDHAAFNSSIFNNKDFALGENAFPASIISNNTVRIGSGELLMRGRHVRISDGSYSDLTIENGTQGNKRIDLIVVKYTRDSDGVEECNLCVIKGTQTTGTPTTPAYSEGEISSGEECDMPLYSVYIDGLNISYLTKLFSAKKGIYDLIETEIKNLQDAISKKIDNLKDINANYHRIYNLSDPKNDTDAANKGYVDDEVSESESRVTNKVTSVSNKISSVSKIQFGEATIPFSTSAAGTNVTVSFSSAF
ncbi:MAG: hypothetical protein ACI3XQ_07045, partial [Eubacteriales bacterium]